MNKEAEAKILKLTLGQALELLANGEGHHCVKNVIEQLSYHDKFFKKGKD